MSSREHDLIVTEVVSSSNMVIDEQEISSSIDAAVNLSPAKVTPDPASSMDMDWIDPFYPQFSQEGNNASSSSEEAVEIKQDGISSLAYILPSNPSMPAQLEIFKATEKGITEHLQNQIDSIRNDCHLCTHCKNMLTLQRIGRGRGSLYFPANSTNSLDAAIIYHHRQSKQDKKNDDLVLLNQFEDDDDDDDDDEEEKEEEKEEHPTTSLTNQKDKSSSSPPPPPQEGIVVDIVVTKILESKIKKMRGKLKECMEKSVKTQGMLQERDQKNGLPLSHSPTMMNTSRSRIQLMDDVILKKWDGSPMMENVGGLKVVAKKRKRYKKKKGVAKKKELEAAAAVKTNNKNANTNKNTEKKNTPPKKNDESSVAASLLMLHTKSKDTDSTDASSEMQQ